MMRSGRLTLAMLVAAATLGGLIGSGAAVFVNAAPTDLLHLVVTARATGVTGPFQQSEFWLDESRSLARVVDQTPSGPSAHASGPNWLLDLPAAGSPALRYETATVGALATKSVFWRVFYFRDALRAGRARIAQASADRHVVVIDAENRSALLDVVYGLPLWETRGGVRFDYDYAVRERLPSYRFPESFFSSPERLQVVRTIETDLQSAANRAEFTLLSAGAAFAGRSLGPVLFISGGNENRLEQVNQIYGGDVQVVTSLLADAPMSVRLGGEAIWTSLGAGTLYRDADLVQINVLRGREAISVFAPDVETAKTVVEALRPVSRR